MIAKLPRAEVSSGWAHSLKILIVDDDQKTRVLLKTFLENNQYEVMVAHEGAGFLAEFAAHSVQLCLVILGVMLPDMDGFALCRSLHKKSVVPIIMLTANADETDRIVGLEAACANQNGSWLGLCICGRRQRVRCLIVVST